MKKLLTLAATGLVCVAGYAQSQTLVKYLAGTPIQSADQLQSGTYFISGISGTGTPVEGLLQSTGDDAPGYFSTMTSVPEGGIADKSYVYYLDVTTAEDGSKTFTVRNLQSNKYFSYEGKDNGGGVHVGRFNVIPVETGNSKIATYRLANNPTYDGAALNIPRFNWAITNAREEDTNEISYCHANDHNGRKRLSYWGGSGNPGASTCAAIGLIPAEAHVAFADNRAEWIISGCSEQNIAANSDGGFNEIKDGNPYSFWHSQWSDAGTEHGTGFPHYFVIDRGESAASTPVAAFDYLPRQSSNSGRITGYKMFVLDNIDDIQTVNASAPGTAGHITDNHASVNAFIEANTPIATGTFNDDANLKKVVLDNQRAGRYVLFVVTSSASGANATCAEFYLYHFAPSITGTLTFKRSSDDANPLVVQTDLEVSKNFPVYEGFTCSNTGTVSSDNATAEYIMNEATTTFYLYNKRRTKYVRVNAAGSELVQEAVETPGAEALFKMIPMGNDNGFAIYHPATDKFVGNIAGSTTPMVDFTAIPQKYYTGKQEAPASETYMSWVGTNSSKSGANYFNDFSGAGASVGGWTWDDDGSRWVIVTDLAKFKENWQLRNDLLAALPNYEAMLTVLGETDTEGLKEWAENYNFGGDVNVAVTPENQVKIDKIMNITLRAEVEIAKRRGNKLATMDFITEAGKTAWTEALAQLEGAAVTQETLDAVNAAQDELGKATVEVSMKFKSTHFDSDYLGANIGVKGADPIAPAPRRWGAGEECRTWTLQSANGTGFYLFNEYTNKYLKHYADGSNPTFVNDASAASVYLISVLGYEDGAETFGLKTFDNGVPANVAYLRSEGANEVQAGSTEKDPSWTIETVSSEEAANEHLAGAKFYYSKFAKGDGVGEYAVANQEAADAAAGVTTDASIDAKRAAANTLFTAQFTLNMPKAGTYLTFKGANNENVALFYTTETYSHGGNDKTILDKTHAGYSDAAAIMYYDGEHLLSYTNGYYLGLSAAGWPTFISATTDMAAGGRGNTPVTLGIAPGSHVGLYQINYARTGDEKNCGLHINTATENGVTYLFADRCGLDTNKKEDLATTTRNEDAHNWVISQVNELPVAIHADGYGSFIAPVAVSFGAENPVYKGDVKGSVLTFTQVPANTDIAPNTPVIIKGTASSTVNAVINYAYEATADAPAALAADESTIRLGGSHIAANQEAETDLATFAKTGDNAEFTDDTTVKLNKVAEGSVIPVNTLLLTLHNNSELIAADGETATIDLEKDNVTGISAIEFRNLDGTREIYDLQGRRVSKTANGVYIINGKKVLVK